MKLSGFQTTSAKKLSNKQRTEQVWLFSDDMYDRIRGFMALSSESESHFKQGKLFLDQKLKEFPNDIVLQTYRAGFLAIEAKYKFFPLDKLQLAQKGIELLDQIVAQHHNHIEIRFVRCAIFAKLPALFGKKPIASSDANWILNQIRIGVLDGNMKNYIPYIIEFFDKNKLMPSSNSKIQCIN